MSLPSDLRARLRLPAMAAPMFLCSGVDLAVAACKGGIIGSLTRNHCRSDEEFSAQIVAVSDALKAGRDTDPDAIIGPLAVNISVGMDKAQRTAALETCRRHNVDIVVTAGGDPAPVAAAVHDWGGRIFHDVTTERFAAKAIMAGVDGIIAIGAGGGGHSGTISHLVLVPAIRAAFDGVIVLAGAVATGRAIRAAEILGADLAYLGTRFIATKESMAPDEYKALLVSQKATDLLYTNAINGLPAMWMKESMRRVGLDPVDLPVAQGHNSNHLPEHVKPWKNLWSAGQGIELIDDIPSTHEVIERLAEEYAGACAIPPHTAAGAWSERIAS